MIERHQFIPETIWVHDDDGWMVPLRRTDDPDRWTALCASDEAIVTQVDDGNVIDGKGIWPSSSSTSPSIMRAMIKKLDIKKGSSVLEIGTGTGLNAAWIAEIVGSENVVTLEVDREVAEQAHTALREAGCSVVVLVRDGYLGYPERAPYDRVMRRRLSATSLIRGSSRHGLAALCSCHGRPHSPEAVPCWRSRCGRMERRRDVSVLRRHSCTCVTSARSPCGGSRTTKTWLDSPDQPVLP